MSKAASGIEHAWSGGNLEGWTLGLIKASRAVTRGSRPKMFHDTMTEILRGSKMDRVGMGWAGYPESCPLSRVLGGEAV